MRAVDRPALFKNKFNLFSKILFYWTLTTCLVANASADENYRISYPNYIRLEEVPTLKKALIDSYAKLNIKNVEFIQMPYNRSEMLLSKNEVDAEIGRAEYTINLLKLNQHAVKTPLTHNLKTFISYKKSKPPTQPIPTGKEKIRKSNLAVNLGVRNYQQKVDSDSCNLLFVDDNVQIKRLIEAGRIDYAITLLDISKISSEIESKVLFKENLLHVVSKKNIHLTESLNKAFKENLNETARKQIDLELENMINKAAR